jgi:hypothetical protein
VQELYVRTLDGLRLETERGNLVYVLAHAELTEQERTEIRHRLAVVEDELLQMLTPNLPN